MHIMISKAVSAVAAGLLFCSAAAPQPLLAQAGQPAQAQPVSVVPNPLDFATAALQIVRAMEQGSAAQIWDASSSTLKRLIPRQDFVAAQQRMNMTLGLLQNRSWRSVERTSLTQPQGQLPAGEFLTVKMVGVGKEGKQVRETVSFILDSDQSWRLIGIARS